jgi:uncharacterized membrane protein
MIDALTVATAAFGFVAAACRVGQMHRSTHRPGVIYWHWVCGALCLCALAVVVMGRNSPTALGMSASIAAYMLLTLHEWRPTPPDWARRQNTERSA